MYGGEPFVEGACEAIKYLTNKYWDRGFDKVTQTLGITEPPRKSRKRERNRSAASGKENCAPATVINTDRPVERKRRPPFEKTSPFTDGDIALGHSDYFYSSIKSSSPARGVLCTIPPAANTYSAQTIDMSYANGSLGPGGYSQQQRPQSQQPPRTRYYDDDDDGYDNDYDDRRGSRQQHSRGYDNDYYDDRGGDYREVVETERYRGPARDFNDRRQSFRSNQDYNQGAVTQYNQSGQRGDYGGRSSSRGRRYSEARSRGSRSRSRSYSRSRSRSRSRSLERGGGVRNDIGKHFDTSLQGIGVGLAGAVVGGMAGRHFGERNPRHKNRDILLGAVIGGLGANAGEKAWHNYTSEKKEKLRDDEDRWEQKWDGRGYGGRSQSAGR